MRKIRTMICVIFAVACVIFGIYMVKTKKLEDHIPPVIHFEEQEIMVQASADDQELLQGVTAEDDKDGDITDSVRVSALSHFIEKGERTVTYIVFDKANQAGTAQRTVRYSDYETPKIYLKEPLRYSINQAGKVDLTENFVVEDCLDGDLTKQLRLTVGDAYYAYTPGEYEITAQVSNSAGDVRAIPLKVLLVDSAEKEESSKYYPVLSDYLVYTKTGKTLKLSDYLEGVVNGNAAYSFAEDAESLTIAKDEIMVEHEIDYAVPGVYPVQYSYTNEEGIKAVTTMYVVVEE